MGSYECSMGESAACNFGGGQRGFAAGTGLEAKNSQHIPYSACRQEGADRDEAGKHESIRAAITPGAMRTFSPMRQGASNRTPLKKLFFGAHTPGFNSG